VPLSIEQTISEFAANLPNEDTSLADWATFASNDRTIYGPDVMDTDIFKNMTMNTAEYDASKKHVFAGFVTSVERHPTLHPLVEPVKGPDGDWLYRFVLMLSGFKDNKKRAILNAMFLCYARTVSYKKFHDENVLAMNDLQLAEAMLEPNTIARMHRQIMKVLGDNSILYKMGDFRYQGGFQAIWKGLFDRTRKNRPDYGTKPNQAVVDLDDFDKIANAEVPYRPLENYNDMMKVLPYQCSSYLTFRAGNEVRSF
jgi:hypothetical protein